MRILLFVSLYHLVEFYSFPRIPKIAKSFKSTFTDQLRTLSGHQDSIIMAAHGETISTDYGNQPGGDRIAHLGPNEHPDSALHRIRTAGSITISPELFEKLYLTPETQVKGDLRKTFGNPTPL